MLQDVVAGWIAQAGPGCYDHIGELPHRSYENLRGRQPAGDQVARRFHSGRCRDLWPVR